MPFLSNFPHKILKFLKYFFCQKKNLFILIVLPIEEISLCPEPSSQPRFRIQGGTLSVTYTEIVVVVVVVAVWYFFFIIFDRIGFCGALEPNKTMCHYFFLQPNKKCANRSKSSKNSIIWAFWPFISDMPGIHVQ